MKQTTTNRRETTHPTAIKIAVCFWLLAVCRDWKVGDCVKCGWTISGATGVSGAGCGTAAKLSGSILGEPGNGGMDDGFGGVGSRVV